MEVEKSGLLIACSCYYPDIKGGGEVSTQLLAEALYNKGFNVIIAAVSEEEKVEFINNIKVYRIKYKNLYWTYKKDNIGSFKKFAWHILDSSNPWIAEKIINIAKSERIESIITSTIEDVSSATWRLAKKEGIKTYHILRSYSLVCNYASMYKNQHNCDKQCESCKALSLLKKYNSQYVDHVVGISNFILNTHLKFGYFRNSLKHVINNICADAKDLTAESQMLKKWVPPPSSEIIKLGYIGNLLPTKGIEYILSAISKTKNSSRYVLIIAGDGEKDYKGMLEETALKLRIKVSFIGHTKQESFFSSIDWLIVPSVWNEPFGRIVIESFFYNIPVIGSNRGGIPELITSQTGFIYNDEDELIQKLELITEYEYSFDFSIKAKYSPQLISSNWFQILLNEKG